MLTARRVRKVNTAGIITTVAGSGAETGSPTVTEARRPARDSSLTGLAVDGAGEHFSFRTEAIVSAK